MSAYTFFLSLHNIFRWLVLVAAAYALIRAYSGWLGRRGWERADRTAGMLFSIAMDIQLLLGLILYLFFSPFTPPILKSFGMPVSSGGEATFFGLEHWIGMLIAAILAHVGSAVSRRGEDSVRKHRTAAIWFTLSVLVVILSIPWWRPLFRF